MAWRALPRGIQRRRSRGRVGRAWAQLRHSARAHAGGRTRSCALIAIDRLSSRGGHAAASAAPGLRADVVASSDNEEWSLYGAPWMQPVATSGKWRGREDRSNRRKLLPWVATGCMSRSMVRRGSTVRVRQRALQKRRKTALRRRDRPSFFATTHARSSKARMLAARSRRSPRNSAPRSSSTATSTARTSAPTDSPRLWGSAPSGTDSPRPWCSTATRQAGSSGRYADAPPHSREPRDPPPALPSAFNSCPSATLRLRRLTAGSGSAASGPCACAA